MILGYLDLKLKDIQKTSDSTVLASFQLNTKYKNLKILYDNKLFPLEIINKVSVDTSNQYFSIPIEKTIEILNYLTNYLVTEGNTFSNLSLIEIKKDKNDLSAILICEKSKKRTVDKFFIKGYTKFPKSYFKYYCRLKKGSVFNKKDVITKSKTINSLEFASNLKPPEVLFNNDSTTLYFYLKKEPANRFDGFIGFANNSETKNLELNGFIDLKLTNNLNYGEQLNFTYKNDGNDQKLFNINITLPYILKTPIGIEANLEIFKKDSSYIITKQNVNLNYLINSENKLFLGIQSTESNTLLTIPQPSLNLTDYNSWFIRGGHLYTQKRQNNLFPIKSLYSILTEFGSRKTDFEKQNQIKVEIGLNHIFILNNKNSIFLSNSSAAIFSDNLFTNELYRFGGINSIRGFEENSINASLYNVLKSEYRYTLSHNLLIHSTVDYAYFENESIHLSDNLTSLGFGLGLKTQTGLFRLIFANGKNSNQNFRFVNTKIHISLNAQF